MLNLEISYSLEFEVERVSRTLSKLEWYIENNYKVTLPSGVTIESSKKEIEDFIRKEYSQEIYEGYKTSIKLQLGNRKEMLEPISRLPFELKDSYNVYLTQYGVGGSYSSVDNSITINIQQKHKEDVLGTLLHEIIHISIEPLIKKYDVSHWKKERLVDLIFDKYFSRIREPQYILEDVSEVDVAFVEHYPDLENVVKVLTKF